VGAKGPQGEIGADALAGVDGVIRHQGLQGYQGLIGLTGPAGAPGPAGPTEVRIIEKNAFLLNITLAFQMITFYYYRS
jgi:hypothetical protein